MLSRSKIQANRGLHDKSGDLQLAPFLGMILSDCTWNKARAAPSAQHRFRLRYQRLACHQGILPSSLLSQTLAS